MEKFLARLFSTVFHPLLVPTLGTFILFNINSYISYSVPGSLQRLTLLLVFLNTAVAPVLIIVLLKKLKVIGSLYLDERQDRAYPILLSAILFYLTFYLLRQLNLPVLFYYFIGGGTLLIILCFFISLFWKISIHMASFGGLTGAVISTSLLLQSNLFLLISCLILASGLLGFARIKLNAHNSMQVYAGYIAGVLVMILTIIRPF